MLVITSLNNEQHGHQAFECGPVFLGSGTKASGPLFHINDPLIASLQCEIRWAPNQDNVKIMLVNHGGTIALDSGPRIHTGVEVELEVPCTFWAGQTAIQILDPKQTPAYDQCLTYKSFSEVNATNMAHLKSSPAPSTLASWFDALGQLQTSQAGSHEFFERAARACFCPGGLDGALILLATEQGWEIAASHICYPEHGFGYRQDLLNSAIEKHSVVFHDSQKMDEINFQLEGHTAIVCPIFDTQDNCVAALYGFRSLNRRNNRQGIRPLEACFVELVAQSISAMMTRLDQDAKAAKARVLLEQAFSPQVAQKLQQNPYILEGQNREVTVMFCDLRNFTEISERIGPKVTYQFLTDVMDQLTEIISQYEGVVIDFYGDGLSAFWNAPLDIANHAELAARCALEIREVVKSIEAKWQPRLLAEIRLGIGIHTGNAQVGNSGSRTRLKYGPRGNTVNLASRLENATAQCGAQILISSETLQRLPQSFVARRVCQAKLPGMAQITQLHELVSGAMTREQVESVEQYETALAEFERREFQECLTQLSKILIKNAEDRVSEFLFKRCQELLDHWDLDNQESTKAQLYPLFEAPESEPEAFSERRKPNEKIPEE